MITSTGHSYPCIKRSKFRQSIPRRLPAKAKARAHATMRFRTVIANVGLLHIRSLNALSKLCIIRLSPDTVHFIVPGNEGREGVQVWSQVKVDTLFSGYRIESNNNNEIWLEIQVEALLRVLKSCEASATYNDSRAALTNGEVTLKLNRRQSDNAPIWAFEIKGQSIHGNAMTISHEIKIHILTPRRQQELNEPLCPPPDIHILLPSLIDLRNIVSRLGQMDSDVKLSANLEGTLELSVDSRSVDLTTTWQRLHIPTSTADADQSQGRPKNQMYSTTVSIKALQKFLTSHLVGGTAIACICERHCVIAYVYIGDINDAGGVLTFFIPAKNVNPDD